MLNPLLMLGALLARKLASGRTRSPLEAGDNVRYLIAAVDHERAGEFGTDFPDAVPASYAIDVMTDAGNLSMARLMLEDARAMARKHPDCVIFFRDIVAV